MSDPIYPVGYFNRFNPAQGYDRLLFLAGNPLQSAELNEMQATAADKVSGVANALFKDGDIVRDAVVIVDPATGAVSASAGALYVRGAVRGVQPRDFAVAVTGTVSIGVYYSEVVVTPLEDPDLLNPASGMRAYMEEGASRIRATLQWGSADESLPGDFYPIHTVEDGVLRAKEAPPAFDAMNQAIARYDRDSTGSSYVASGMEIKMLDDVNGRQVYSVGDGRARVCGFGVEFSTSRRLAFDPAPDVRLIDSEPHLSDGSATQRITFNKYPGAEVLQVHITAQKTVTLTHGAFQASVDPLPDSSVLQIVTVKQGGTTYTKNTDFKQTGDAVDWTPNGLEPASGSTYDVTYTYIAAVPASAIDPAGCSVSGAVNGTVILVTYNHLVPRVDAVCVDQDGDLLVLKGVAADYNSLPPSVPANLLKLGSIYQSWDGNRRVVSDGVRMVPMSDIAAISTKLDRVMNLLAQQQLQSDVHTRDAGTKKGLFAEPFADDSLRDPGIAQTGAIVNGELVLPVTATVKYPTADVAAPTSLNFTYSVALSQEARTGAMKINPYQAFDGMPGVAKLTPSVDRWSTVVTDWASPVTQDVLYGWGYWGAWDYWGWNGWGGWGYWGGNVGSTTENKLLSSKSSADRYLRQIDVTFSVSGFGPGEELQSVTFDGVAVTPVAS